MASKKKPAARARARKRTSAPLTKIACACDYLANAADEPEVPIVFDARMNEYHITTLGAVQGALIIRHCPWCGGAAPTSRRASFFATITQAEEERLRALTRGLTTLSGVIRKLGRPDADFAEGLTVRSRKTEREPSKITSYRSLVYEGLSKTAEVRFTDYGPDGGVRAPFQGKYLGPSKTDA